MYGNRHYNRWNFLCLYFFYDDVIKRKINVHLFLKKSQYITIHLCRKILIQRWEKFWLKYSGNGAVCGRRFNVGKMIYIVCVAAGAGRARRGGRRAGASGGRFLKQIQSTADMAEYYYWSEPGGRRLAFPTVHIERVAADMFYRGKGTVCVWTYSLL